MEEVEATPIHGEIIYEGSRNCRCAELEKRAQKAEATIVELELEVGKRKSEYEEVEVKLKKLEAERYAVENEVKGFKMGKDKVVDLTEEEDGGDKLFQLMLENKVLECEKKRAESEVEKWKGKVRQFELCILKLNDTAALASLAEGLLEVLKDNDGSFASVNMGQSQCKEQLVDSVGAMANNNTPGEPSNDGPYKNNASSVGGKRGIHLEPERKYAKLVKKQLSFDEERSPIKVLAPVTPGVGKPSCLSVINVSDSDDDDEIRDIQMTDCNDKLNGKACVPIVDVSGGTLNIKKKKICKESKKKVLSELNYAEDLDDYKDSIPCLPTPKRKRVANIVTSDSESDGDDDVPLSRIKKMHLKETKSATPCVHDEMKGIITRSRRRLMKAGGNGNPSSMTTERKYERGIPTTDDVEDGESEVESDSEGDSLKDFIVDDSSDSEASNSGPSNCSEDEMDGNVDLGDVISTLRRSRGCKLNWEFEGDMLAAFGKDVELCMKAVCALYRQQTTEEKVSKEALVYNRRGFSKLDAKRGCRLAEFLTDGDPLGDVTKTVEELQEYDPAGVELCKKLAAHYSKQLFEIYKNKEDPFFLPA